MWRITAGTPGARVDATPTGSLGAVTGTDTGIPGVCAGTTSASSFLVSAQGVKIIA